MYVPPLFRETDPDFIRKFLKENGFATLVSCVQGIPVATHLPLEVNEAADSRLVLSGHMSRENPQWRSFSSGAEILAIFQGHHSYVSASWYSVPSVPTWNYLSVHAYGTPRLVDDPAELLAMLKRLVDRQEGRYPEGERYTLDGLPRATLEGLMSGVAGFQIPVTRVEAAAKMSQNRDPRDRLKIIEKLRAEGSPPSRGVAREMERRNGVSEGHPRRESS
jgi:transcriptional regulator